LAIIVFLVIALLHQHFSHEATTDEMVWQQKLQNRALRYAQAMCPGGDASASAFKVTGSDAPVPERSADVREELNSEPTRKVA